MKLFVYFCRMKSEDRITQEIVTWMWNTYPQTRKCFFHVPNEGKRGKLEAIRLKAMGVVAGIPDLILAWRGRIYGFEVKTDTGAQSDNQKAIQKSWDENGNPYYIVRSESQFKAIAVKIVSGNLPIVRLEPGGKYLEWLPTEYIPADHYPDGPILIPPPEPPEL